MSNLEPVALPTDGLRILRLYGGVLSIVNVLVSDVPVSGMIVPLLSLSQATYQFAAPSADHVVLYVIRLPLVALTICWKVLLMNREQFCSSGSFVEESLKESDVFAFVTMLLAVVRLIESIYVAFTAPIVVK